VAKEKKKVSEYRKREKERRGVRTKAQDIRTVRDGVCRALGFRRVLDGANRRKRGGRGDALVRVASGKHERRARKVL